MHEEKQKKKQRKAGGRPRETHIPYSDFIEDRPVKVIQFGAIKPKEMFQLVGEKEWEYVMVPTYFSKYGKHLSSDAKEVYRALLRFHDLECNYAYGTNQTIQEETGLDRNKVSSALEELRVFLWLYIDLNCGFSCPVYRFTCPIGKNSNGENDPITFPSKIEAQRYKKALRQAKSHRSKRNIITKIQEKDAQLQDKDKKIQEIQEIITNTLEMAERNGRNVRYLQNIEGKIRDLITEDDDFPF
ncbi:MAG TPA: hypothetical protein VF648_03205 [Pyrinomonadaceae bacterium]|jgi:uncharacterized Zn finger protein (UPF0148 family)